MHRRRAAVLALVVVVAVLAGVGWAGGLLDAPETATVTVRDADGTTLGVVEARVADDVLEQYRGLSGVDSLPEDRGMLFVHDGEAARTFVMREMSIPLDVVFVGANGQITAIHHAPVPGETPSKDLVRYSGRAKWVLEVPYGWTDRHGVEVGDRVVVERV